MEIITDKQLTNGFRTGTLPQLRQHEQAWKMAQVQQVNSAIAAVIVSAVVAHSSADFSPSLITPAIGTQECLFDLS